MTFFTKFKCGSLRFSRNRMRYLARISSVTKKRGYILPIYPLRAVNGTRTRDPQLGKLVLYQLSYYRKTGNLLLSPSFFGDTKVVIFLK